MKILLVEDDGPKRQRVMDAILEVPGVAVEDVAHAADVRSAKQHLSLTRFDVMIVDLLLPMRADQSPRPGAGADLVEELATRDTLRKPTFVIGLSAYDTEVSSASERLRDFLFTVVHYDLTDVTWRTILQRRLEHCTQILAQPPQTTVFDVDIGILCALEQPELAAVLALDWEWRVLAVPGDDAVYYSGVLTSTLCGDRRFRAVAVAAPRMGLPAAASATSKLIYTFRPRLLVMTGITAGIAGEVDMGDVLIGDPCWDWGSGKWDGSDERPRFAAHPHQVALHSRARRAATLLAGNAEHRAAIRAAWQGPKPPSELKVVLGPLASGAAVVANDGVVQRIKGQNRKVAGIDMESYAVVTAALDAAEPRPVAMTIKGVSDHCNAAKSDLFQAYAAYASANVMERVVAAVLCDG